MIFGINWLWVPIIIVHYFLNYYFHYVNVKCLTIILEKMDLHLFTFFFLKNLYNNYLKLISKFIIPCKLPIACPIWLISLCLKWHLLKWAFNFFQRNIISATLTLNLMRKSFEIFWKIFDTNICEIYFTKNKLIKEIFEIFFIKNK